MQRGARRTSDAAARFGAASPTLARFGGRHVVAEHRTTDRSGFSAPRTVPTLVGRAREQEILREELAAAIEGQGRLVLLGGEAGIGKTTLARDLIREATARGVRVLAGHCYDLTNTPPYGPWLELASNYPSAPALPPPPAAFAGGVLEQVTDQAALFAEVRAFFAQIGEAGPALVLLEDLHWADPASLDLLRNIALHLRHWPILMLATYRAEELTRRHPFAQQLPALVREAEALRLDLRRLGADALRALVITRYRLPEADEARLAAYLDRHAEGNPFFATELLRALEEEGLLRPVDGRWALFALERVGVPAFLRQVIEGRVARLGEDVRQPMAIAAVIGQEAPLDLWAEVADLDDGALLAIVEQAVEAHLLEADRDGVRVRFVHAVTREALYEGILPPRRRMWHQQIAERLVADDRADPDAVAYHLQQAGDSRAWEWLVHAADRAQHAYAWLTAVDRLQDAADLLAGVAGQEQTRGWLLYRLSRLQRISDPAGAIAPLDESERLAALADDPVLAAEARYTRGIFLCYSDRLREGLAAIEVLHPDIAMGPDQFWGKFLQGFAKMASPPTPDDELALERLRSAGLDIRRCVLVWFLGLAGRPRDAVDAGERFRAVLAPGPGATEGHRYAAAFADHGLGIAYAALGRPDDAQQAWARSRANFRDVDHHVLVAFTLCGELWDRVYPFVPTDPTVRRRYAAEAEAALGRAGGALAPGVSPRLAWLSCFALDGRWEETLGILRDLPTPSNNCLRREISGPHATIARHRGDPETAWRRIRPLFPAGPATAPGDLIHQEGLLLQRLAADLCLDAGDFAGARAWLEAHDVWLAWSESVLGQADGRLAWARYHLAEANVARARELAFEARTLAGDPDQPLVSLAAHRFLGQIGIAERNYPRAETHLGAALDLAGACEAPFERALTLLALAELRAAVGTSDEAAALLDEVRQICVPLGAAPTLARADALAARLATNGEAYPAGLTQREVDVLRLLAQRQTDKEIAEALFLGPRTVQSHVAHILNKLGVGNRRDAAAEANRLGLL